MAILQAVNDRNFTMRLLNALPLLAAALCLSGPMMAATPDLSTHAERSGYAETGRYAEVERLCRDFQAAYPAQVRCFDFGRTPEGRPMWVLAANADGALTPGQARAKGLPVSLFQGGIHAGEIDGKDAGFKVLRELLEKPGKHDPLRRQVMLFVPVFNVDGHERFAAWNRPNQRGPKEMGWRVTAHNHNLNRDYAKAESPEMQAMLGLVNDWDPLFYVDLHVTDGAQFRHDISVQVEPKFAGDPALRAIGRRFQDAVLAELRRGGSLPLPYYPSFRENDDPASGFADGVSPPRFSTGYFQLRNRFGVLVETHSWRTYPERVDATVRAVRAMLAQVARHGTDWLAAARQADRDGARLAGTAVALEYAAGPTARSIDFLGYAYTRTPSEVSGALMTRYDERTPAVWKLPLYDDVRPSLEVTAPAGGYVVPAAYATLLAGKFDTHGIAYVRLNAAQRMPVEQYRAESAEFGQGSVEGRQRLSVRGQWQPAEADIGAGSLFVPIAQAKARLVMALLEPQAPDSYLAWGLFNNHFERKEYMEDYVAEAVAREMLRDPALKAEFEAKLAADKAFADSPGRRLEFFARRHPSWDDRYRLYPVLRSARVLSR